MTPAGTGPLTACGLWITRSASLHRPGTAAQARSIDTSVTVHRARGRTGCNPRELLCIGNTHQPGFRPVRAARSRLPYVARIDQAFFE